MCATSPKSAVCVRRSIDAWRRYHEKALATQHFLMSPRIHSQNDSLNFAHTPNVLRLCTCCVCRDILSISVAARREGKIPRLQSDVTLHASRMRAI